MTLRTDEADVFQVWVDLLKTWILGWGTGAVRAVVWMKGWEWFVASTFAVVTLSFIEAWGLSVLATFATVQLRFDGGPQRIGPWGRAAASLIVSGMFFLSLLILSGFRG